MSRRTYVMRNNVVSAEVRVPEPALRLDVAPAGRAGPSGAAVRPASPRAGDGSGLADLLSTGPLFGVGRRGYDRRAVDGYVESVQAELAGLRLQQRDLRARYRATAAALLEARRTPEDRGAEILAEARAEAAARMENVAALRQAAQVARSEARRDRAGAAEELARARVQAEAWRREARDLRDAAERAAAGLQQEMDALRLERDEALAHLHRVTRQIEQALESLSVLPDAAGALTGGPQPVAG